MNMNKAQLVFVNTDDEGKITQIYYGINIIPDRPYMYFFMISDDVIIPMDVTIADLKKWQDEYSDYQSL